MKFYAIVGFVIMIDLTGCSRSVDCDSAAMRPR